LFFKFGVIRDCFLGGSFFYIMVFFYGEVFHNILEFDSFLSSSDKEMFKRMRKQGQLVFALSMVGANTLEFFNANELELGIGQLVD